MNEIIVDELPKSCGECEFNVFDTDENGPDVYYCKALDSLNKDDELGVNGSEYEKNMNKMRDSRCPLKLKGYCSEEIRSKMLDILLSEQTEENKKNLIEIFRYFLNIKKGNK